jgi:hypothetical protein
MKVELNNVEHLKELEEMVESERKRLQDWYSSTFIGTKHESIYLFRCRRLAKIRENLKLLAETYE